MRPTPCIATLETVDCITASVSSPSTTTSPASGPRKQSAMSAEALRTETYTSPLASAAESATASSAPPLALTARASVALEAGGMEEEMELAIDASGSWTLSRHSSAAREGAPCSSRAIISRARPVRSAACVPDCSTARPTQSEKAETCCSEVRVISRPWRRRRVEADLSIGRGSRSVRAAAEATEEETAEHEAATRRAEASIARCSATEERWTPATAHSDCSSSTEGTVEKPSHSAAGRVRRRMEVRCESHSTKRSRCAGEATEEREKHR
mmetsp:Transcript_17950/g.42946  ORF Transcript_17950/g.42946 Transcript_17950/m.42946 type:complete len:270 (-) Transcript_17950:748-1557(-)